MSQSAVIAEIVETMRTLAGPHPGFRPVHAKGIVCSGTFRPSPEARRVSRAVHLQGAAVPAVIRFANASGDPEVHDGLPGVRSLAVKFQLPDGKSADVLANSVEGFVAKTPGELLEFLRAQLPNPATGKPDPDAVPRFLAAHHAEHAFRFTAADGSSRFGRYHFVPAAGEALVPPDEAGTRSPTFLRDELESRLRKG